RSGTACRDRRGRPAGRCGHLEGYAPSIRRTPARRRRAGEGVRDCASTSLRSARAPSTPAVRDEATAEVERRWRIVVAVASIRRVASQGAGAAGRGEGRDFTGRRGDAEEEGAETRYLLALKPALFSTPRLRVSL